MNDQLPDPVTAVVDAINAADTEAFVAAFAADGSVDDCGRVLTGPEGRRQPDALSSWKEGERATVRHRVALAASTSDSAARLIATRCLAVEGRSRYPELVF